LEVAVTDAITGARIPGAQVRLTAGLVQSPEERQKIISSYPVGQQELLRPEAAAREIRFPASSLIIQTDQSGQATFRGIEPGPYKLHAAADKYVIAFYGSPNRETIGDTLEISGDQRISLQLTPSSAISGTITDDHGTAVSGVSVYLLSRAFNVEGDWRYRVEARTTTDTSGSYVIKDVRVGRYFVAAGREPRIASETAPSNERTKELERQAYSWSYYPGVADPARANPIDLIPSGRMSGMDFSLQSAALYRVRGRFLNAGLSAPGVYFETLLTGPAPPFDRMMGTSMAPSTREAIRGEVFELKGLTDGIYGIGVTLMNGRTKVIQLPNQDRDKVPRYPVYDGFVQFTVAGGDMDGLDVRVEMPTAIRGVVRREDGGPLPVAGGYTARPLAHSLDAKNLVNPLTVALWNESGEIRGSRDSGRFHAYAVPGNYKLVLTGLDSTAYVKEVRLNGSPVSAGSMDLSAGSELDIVVATNSGTITGVVTDQRANPIQTVICGVLLPALTTPPNVFSKAFNTNASGSFRVQGVPPGSYRLFFWKNQDEFSCFDPALLQRSQTQATLIRVRARMTATVNTKVIQD
jgi:hypothetical protein